MSSYHRGPYGGGGVTLAVPPFTPMVKRILWVLGVAFLVQFALQILQRLGGVPLASWYHGVFALWPRLEMPLPGGEFTPPIAIWQLGTYGLLHDGLMHLLFNALGIWMFGGDVERVLGSRGLLRFFVVCVLGGGLAVTIGSFLVPAMAPTIGASGGVLGLVLAFAMFFPERQVFIFPIPVPMPAWVMAAVYGLINVYGAIQTAIGPGEASISYAAHIGGLAAGYLYLKGFIKPGSWSNPFKRPRSKFRVIPGQRPGPYDIN